MSATKYPTAILATVRYSPTQSLHELKLLDAQGDLLPFVKFIDIGRDFFVDEYESGTTPPTGAAIATMNLQLEGLQVGGWRQDSLPGWIADVRPFEA